MLNYRILAAWPNWFVIPIILIFWIAVGTLGAELLGARPYQSE